MSASLAPVPADVTRTIGVGAGARARSRARWATTPTPSRVLAKHYGVSASEARHLRIGSRESQLATVLRMIADPEVDAGPIIVAVLESWEERFLYQPTAELRARLKQLREVVEHRAQAEQDRAVLCRDGAADACRQHASILIEQAALEDVLAVAERAH